MAEAGAEAGVVAWHFLGCIDRSHEGKYPFRHWLIDNVLPAASCAAIDALPFAPPPIDDTLGRRETNNSTRRFFNAEQRARHGVCAAVAGALHSDAVVRRIERLCDVAVGGSFLRIEYCLDTEGFWLEPHTDIGAKLFTMLVYLSDEPGSEAWGTDLLDDSGNLVVTTPHVRNRGLIFIPGTDTWHGFHRRPIAGVRRSLIVNYVKDEWRARHELAFPERPVLR
jgi:hypothetical protein